MSITTPSVDIDKVLGWGPIADRGSAVGKKGWLWYGEDTLLWYRSTGSAWTTLPMSTEDASALIVAAINAHKDDDGDPHAAANYATTSQAGTIASDAASASMDEHLTSGFGDWYEGAGLPPYDPHGDRAHGESYADGAASGAVATHESDEDPHTGYVLESREGVANGIATLDATGKIPTTQVPVLDIGDGGITGLAAIAQSGDISDLVGLDANELIVGTATDPTTIAAGADGQVLMAGTDGVPAWSDNYATDMRIRAYNDTGSSIAKGKVVRITGATGGLPTIALADNDAESTSASTIGMVDSSSIADGHAGFVAISGTVKGLNTSGYAAGDTLYLSGTAGSVTTSKPAAPNHLVTVGYVTASDATNGEILLHIQNGYELGELHNVSAASPANGAALVYDDSTGLWTSKAADFGVDVVFDGGVLVPTAGTKVRTRAKCAGTIVGVSLLADATGSAVVDIKKSTYTGYPTTSSICASAKPTLSSAQKNSDTTLTGWTTTVAAGDVLEFVLDSISTIKALTVSLTIRRT